MSSLVLFSLPSSAPCFFSILNETIEVQRFYRIYEYEHKNNTYLYTESIEEKQKSSVKGTYYKSMKAESHMRYNQLNFDDTNL